MMVLAGGKERRISSRKYRLGLALGFSFQAGIVFAFNDSRRFQHILNDKETI